MKSYKIKQGEYLISEEVLQESINRRKFDLSGNRRVRDSALELEDSNKREGILERNPELTLSLEPQDIAQEWADCILKSINATHPEIMRYVENYGQYHKLEDIAILTAHGNVFCKKGKNGPRFVWAYQDKGKHYPVQRAINKLDGDFSALVLFLCYRENNSPLISKKSLLIMPDREIRVSELEGTPGIYNIRFSLYDPMLRKRDREIGSYTIESALRDLKKKSKTRGLK